MDKKRFDAIMAVVMIVWSTMVFIGIGYLCYIVIAALQKYLGG